MNEEQEKLKTHLKNQNLDLRKINLRNEASGSSMRFIDQKVTPDIIYSTAHILHQSKKGTQPFSVVDIWHSQNFAIQYESIYGKPEVKHEKAKNEYDKVVAQPLKTLAFAGILNERKRSQHLTFTIEEPELLEYLARNEVAGFRFLRDYLVELLKQSGMYGYFRTYRESMHTQDDYAELKERFEAFIFRETNIKGKFEPRRLFPKVLNILAAEWRVPGSAKGRVSRYPQTVSDLSYNKQNFRDLGKKAKHEPRSTTASSQADIPNKSLESKMITEIKNRGKGSSELHDSFSNGQATQVHHIVPRSGSVKFRDYPENLILLTATQHNTKAHPSNDTSRIDPMYQIECLLAKADTIEKSLENEENLYKIEQFAEVIEHVTRTKTDDSNLSRLRKAITLHRENI